MQVSQIMTPDVRCISPSHSLVDAAGLMRELDVGALPICDNDRLAGMITDRDIVLRGVAEGRHPAQTTVREVMSPGIVYAYDDYSVTEVAHMMREHQMRRLPVLNREKRLVGIVALGDIAVAHEPAVGAAALEGISEHRP